MLLSWLLLISFVSSNLALDNGLALTPPMGWLTWQRFRCITDCKTYPDECISENLIKRTADRLVADGYLDAGYDYIAIDDCWLEHERGPDGKLVPDKERFPSGMKALGDYIHDSGLKFGLYQDYGTKTCGGYPGILGNEQLDMDTFVEWGVDYIKLDGCYVQMDQMDTGYPMVGALLNATGRPVLYSCSWPAYQENYNFMRNIRDSGPDYESIAKHCNLWRNWGDIQDSWQSVATIMTWFGDNQDRFAKYAGPGNWNDPDMLLIGNFGLSLDQAKVQMAVWSVMAAPLLMSVDLDTIRPEFKEILLNKDIIAVNQDPLGRQGLRVLKLSSRVSVWNRELEGGAYAIAFVSERDDGIPQPFSFTFDQMQLPKNYYTVKDLYHGEQDRTVTPNDDSFRVRINPTGVKFYKFSPSVEKTDPKN